MDGFRKTYFRTNVVKDAELANFVTEFVEYLN